MNKNKGKAPERQRMNCIFHKNALYNDREFNRSFFIELGPRTHFTRREMRKGGHRDLKSTIMNCIEMMNSLDFLTVHIFKWKQMNRDIN